MGGFQRNFLTYTLAATLSISGILSVQPAVAACDTKYEQNIQPKAGLMFTDLVAVRPVSLIASVAGTAIWVVSLPLTLLGGNTEEAGKVLVADPLCYTFARPLGHMEKTP